ncbi:MAG: alkaline phosphatase D family protein [Polyangiales bacterium]
MSGPTRREVLASLASALVGCGTSPPAADDAGVDDAPNWSDVPDDVDLGPSVPVRFEHGVASGDPLRDRVILWTRATPMEVPRAGDKAVLRWELSSTPDFADLVAHGNVVADARRDWTVKVDAQGLRPGGVWYYRFTSGDARSPIGRTRTAPEGTVARLRFAAVSCASLAHGFFHVYRDIARRADLDLVLHLGDYIYEYPTGLFGNVRPYDPPTEIVSLADYRQRYAQYRRDPDLQEMHRQHPMAAIWDDHEFANNAFRMGTDGRPDPRFAARADAARRAWFEWMPTREGMGERIYRRLRYGDLADVMLLDTRFDGRDPQKPFETPRLHDPSRSILGMTQEAWLAAQLADRGPRWRVLAQQVILSPRPIDLNVDAWDGYPAARERLLASLRLPEVGDPVVLTGDVHTSWAFDIAPDPRDPRRYDPDTGSGSLGVELVTPGVSAPSLLRMGPEEEERMRRSLRHLKFVDLTRRGWVLLDLTATRLQAVWNLMDDGTIERRDVTLAPRVAGVLESRPGTRHLEARPAPDAPPENPPRPAP